jgi:hypothetical protein
MIIVDRKKEIKKERGETKHTTNRKNKAKRRKEKVK